MLNDVAWEMIFEKLGIVDVVKAQGFFDVSASTLRKESGGREPRLLAKIDHESNRPQAFKRFGLNILSVSSSSYRIGPFDFYQDLPPWTAPGAELKIAHARHGLESLYCRRLTSESAVIYTAFATEMIKQFCGEDVVPTVSGRMRTSRFQFKVDNFQGGASYVEVDGAQIEIDAGFEGDTAFYIFETKNNMVENFNLKQLYYPYRYWEAVLKKPVRCVFLTHANDVFDFYEIEFQSLLSISSARLKKHERFAVIDASAEKSNGDYLRNRIESLQIGDAPFPQADDFHRVLDLTSFLLDCSRTRDELASNYDFDPRQSAYYADAARYLGLAEISESGAYLATQLAAEIFAEPVASKYELLCELLHRVPSVAGVINQWRILGRKPTVEEAKLYVNGESRAAGLSESTIRRRTQTILSWANWTLEVQSGLINTGGIRDK